MYDFFIIEVDGLCFRVGGYQSKVNELEFCYFIIFKERDDFKLCIVFLEKKILELRLVFERSENLCDELEWEIDVLKVKNFNVEVQFIVVNKVKFQFRVDLDVEKDKSF